MAPNQNLMNILIINLHSALNLGDDAIMAATLEALQGKFPAAKISLAANDPASWGKYDDVEVIGSLTAQLIYLQEGRWQARYLSTLWYLLLLPTVIAAYRLLGRRLTFGSRLLAAYHNADLVLSCGGGNFYAHTAFSPFFIWSLISLGLAVGLDKKVVMLPQSIGPIEGAAQRLISRLLFNRVQLIMSREEETTHFLTEELKVDTPLLQLPDLAFGLPPAPPPPDPPPSGADGRRIGVTVIDRAAQRKGFDRQQAYEQALEQCLVKLGRQHRAHLYIFVQCYGPDDSHDDRRAAYRLYHRLEKHNLPLSLLDTFRDARQIKAAYCHMDCLIGSRMHTAIFGLSNQTPVALIAYQPKAFGLMAGFGLSPYCVDIEQVTAGQLYTLVSDLLEDRPALKDQIKSHYAHIRHLLKDWTDHLE